ncbi:MAG: choice-of-anchor D domain-containing protein [Pseudomonadota bacterium]|nr:choice-of-anchor D domain-containing protein [Pseudomonadota bacterium]
MPLLRRLSLLVLAGCNDTGDLPSVEVSPTSVDLGTVAVGEVATAELTIINQGPGIATFNGISLANGSTFAWSLVSADTADLFAGATSRIEVAFAPNVEGASTTQLEIRTNDPDHPVLQVPLAAMAGGNGIVDSAEPVDTGAPDDSAPPTDPAIDDDGDGVSEVDGDCDDAAAGVHPAAAETCDGVDNNCSGTVDDLDLDGDGHSPCDAGGDCDDTNAGAFPLLVDASVDPGGDDADGTAAAPFPTIAAALVAVDAVCHTVVLLPGTHTANVSVDRGPLTVRGAVTDASDVEITPPPGARAFAVGATGRLTLETLTLTGALGTLGDGGAVYVNGGTATLSDVRLVSNATTDDGGAIAVESGTLTLNGCTLEGNTAEDDGGALYASESTVTDNGSDWGWNAARSGGAVLAHESTLTLHGSSILDNTSGESGGGVVLRGGTGSLDGALFQGNYAGARGGAVYTEQGATGTLRNLLVVGNRAAEEGGGVAVTGVPTGLVVANNTIVGNDAGGYGGGLYVRTDFGASLYVASNIVAWSGGSNGVWASDDSGPSVVYTLAYGNAGEDLSVGDAWEAGGNLVADPLFTTWSDDGNAENDVLTLDPASPALDSGPQNGEGPPGYRAWNDLDGSRNDRGYTGGPGAG